MGPPADELAPICGNSRCNSRRNAKGDPRTSIIEIENVLEFNERTMQSHLQLQLVVHRLSSLHRKMQVTIEAMNGRFDNGGSNFQNAEAQLEKIAKVRSSPDRTYPWLTCR